MFNFGSTGGYTGFGGAPQPQQQQQQQQGFGQFGFAQQQQAQAVMGQAKDVPVPLPPGTDSITCLQWSPNSQFLAASSWDNKVSVWEVKRAPGQGIFGVEQKAQKDFGAPVLSIAWSPDGSSIFAVGCNNKLRLWNLQANTDTEIGGHNAPINAVYWNVVGNNVITAGWDKTIRFWDVVNKKEVGVLNLPDKIHAMDVLGPAMVVATANKQLHVYNLMNPGTPTRSFPSPLKHQIRFVRIFHDMQFFGAVSVEGRCAIRCLDENMDKQQESVGGQLKSTYSFSFKCHRDNPDSTGRSNRFIYPVNSIDTYPLADSHAIFVTGGGDGIYNFWDRGRRFRVKEYRPFQSASPNVPHLPVVFLKFNSTGDMLACAGSYDWSKGADGYNPSVMQPKLFIHPVIPDSDLRNPANKK